MQSCKNWCERSYIRHEKNPRLSLAEQNAAYCRVCECNVQLSTLINGVFCPCCHGRVRTNPRSKIDYTERAEVNSLLRGLERTMMNYVRTAAF
jgi:hypothetical protein